MYKILALSGGGSRGYLTLEVLAYIEKTSGKKISDMFDLIVGTSSGALIGLLLDNLPAWYIGDIFRHTLKHSLFYPNKFNLGGFATSLYNTSKKIEALNLLLQNKTSVINFDFAATSYDIKNSKAVIFNTLEYENNEKYFLVNDFNLVDSVIASSAAPIYWDPYVYHNMILIDGAFCANNPTSIGIKLALNKNIKLQDLAIVDIGTGITTRNYDFIKGSNPYKWIGPCFNIFTSGQTNITTMLYSNESLTYYNLDTQLLHANDDIDDVSYRNFEHLTLDAKCLIQSHEKTIDKIISTF